MAQLNRMSKPMRSHLAKLPCPSFKTNRGSLENALHTDYHLVFDESILIKGYGYLFRESGGNPEKGVR